MEPLRLQARKRPITEEKYRQMCERMEYFTNDPDDFFIIELTKDREGLLYVQGCKHGPKVRIELGFDMRAFDWSQPLLLGGDLKLEEARQLLRDLLVRNQDSDKIRSLIGGFRQIDY